MVETTFIKKLTKPKWSKEEGEKIIIGLANDIAKTMYFSGIEEYNYSLLSPNIDTKIKINMKMENIETKS